MVTDRHPFALPIVCLAWIAASILLFRLSFQAVTILVAAIVLLGPLRQPPGRVALITVPFMLFGAGFLSTSLLFRQDGGSLALFADGSVDRVTAGLTLFARAVACGLTSAVFAFGVDPGRLVKAAMREARLPPTVAYALFHALDAVADFRREVWALRLAARQARSAGRKRWPPVTVTILIPLLAGAVRRASRAALAMESRGLAAGPVRTLRGAPVWRRGDGVLIAIGLGLLAAAVALSLALPLSLSDLRGLAPV